MLNKDEKGAAVVELALLTPFIAFLVMIAVDIFGIIQDRQQLSFVVREFASVTYRTCTNEKTKPLVESCIENATKEIQDIATELGFDAVIKVYKVNGNSTTLLPATLKGKLELGDSISSRFDIISVSYLKSYDPELRPNLVTVEARSKYKTVLPFFTGDSHAKLIF